MHTRTTWLIIIKEPEEISTNNIEDTIIRHNPDLILQKRNIVLKYICVTKKKYRNAVIEVGPDTKYSLLYKKKN